MIGYEWSVPKFLWCLFFMYFSFLYFTYYGMMAVAVTPNQHVSTIISAGFYSVWNIFSGFIIPRPVSFIFHSYFIWMIILIIPFWHGVTEDPSMVEVVQLGKSNFLEFVWIGGFTIWRYKANHWIQWRNNNSGRVCENLLWFQAWFSWSGCSCDSCIHTSFCIGLCCISEDL